MAANGLTFRCMPWRAFSAKNQVEEAGRFCQDQLVERQVSVSVLDAAADSQMTLPHCESAVQPLQPG